jgi:CheY-like chemotaxis protein
MSYVLVVEDDPLGADAARDFLASAGHSVHVVPTPAVAARLIVWSRPDVVLSDRCLPSYGDHALLAVCDRLAIPLIDLPSAILLMGRKERCSQQVTAQPLSAVR